MIRQFDHNLWINRSQQTTGQVTMIFPEQNRRQSRPPAVQHVHVNARNPDQHYDEFELMDREKQAVTARWVLNVIAAHETYHKTLKVNKSRHQSQVNGNVFNLTKMIHFVWCCRRNIVFNLESQAKWDRLRLDILLINNISCLFLSRVFHHNLLLLHSIHIKFVCHYFLSSKNVASHSIER